jgi:hypothetical protein
VHVSLNHLTKNPIEQPKTVASTVSFSRGLPHAFAVKLLQERQLRLLGLTPQQISAFLAAAGGMSASQ